MLNVVDGCPSDMATGNRRAVCCTWLTYAQDQLALIVPVLLRAQPGARRRQALVCFPQPFHPIGDGWSNRGVRWPAAGHRGSVGRTSGVTVDLAARRRDRWRAAGS